MHGTTIKKVLLFRSLCSCVSRCFHSTDIHETQGDAVCQNIFVLYYSLYKKTSYFPSHKFRNYNKTSNTSWQVIIIPLLTNVSPVYPTTGSRLGVPQAVPTEHNPVHFGDKILNVSVAENSKTICLFTSINCWEKGLGEGRGAL
jgi:hypothetical protein